MFRWLEKIFKSQRKEEKGRMKDIMKKLMKGEELSDEEKVKADEYIKEDEQVKNPPKDPEVEEPSAQTPVVEQAEEKPEISENIQVEDVKDEQVQEEPIVQSLVPEPSQIASTVTPEILNAAISKIEALISDLRTDVDNVRALVVEQTKTPELVEQGVEVPNMKRNFFDFN